MTTLASSLQKIDLIPVHLVLCYLGVALSVVQIQIANYHRDPGRDDHFLIRLGTKIATAAIGICMGWAAVFGVEQDWQPWPPYLILLVAINVRMALSIASSYVGHRKTEGVMLSSSVHPFLWIGMAMVAVWMLWFDHPKIYYNETVKADGPVKNGDKLFLSGGFCKDHYAVKGTVERFVRDKNKIEYPMPAAPARYGPGCVQFKRGLDLPDLEPGEYDYVLCAQFRVNFLRNVKGCSTPIKFSVVP